MIFAQAVRKIHLIGFTEYKGNILFSAFNRSAGLISVPKVIISLMIIAMPYCGIAQNRLYVSHKKKPSRNHAFKIGDEMRFKTQKDNMFFTGTIEAFDNLMINFEGFEIPLDEIRKIDLSGLANGRLNYKNYYIYLPLGAIIFVGADLVNNPGFNISPGIAIASGAMVVAAIIFYFLHRRIANRDKAWQFSILDN